MGQGLGRQLQGLANGLQNGQRAAESIRRGDIGGALRNGGRAVEGAQRAIPETPAAPPPQQAPQQAPVHTTAPSSPGVPVVLPPYEASPTGAPQPEANAAPVFPAPGATVAPAAEQELHNNLANWRAEQKISAVAQLELIKAGIYSPPSQGTSETKTTESGFTVTTSTKQTLTGEQLRFIKEKGLDRPQSAVVEAEAASAIEFNLRNWRQAQGMTAQDQSILLQHGAYRPPSGN